MKKTYIIVILSFIVFILLVLNWLRPTPQRVQIKIVKPPFIIASLPHWVAVEKKFYGKANLEIKDININDSKLMITALYSGDADILPAVSLVDVINHSIVEPIKPLIFSHSRMRKSPAFEALIVPRGSDISSLKNLHGKTIGVYPGITARTVLKHYLIKNKVNVDSIKFITLPPPDHIRFLQSGDIQCSHSYDPFKTSALIEGQNRPLSDSVYAYFNEPSGIGVSVISKKFMDSYPEAAKRVFKVWDMSVDFIRDNRREARMILKKYLKLNEKVALESKWVDVTKINEFSVEIMKKTVNTLKEINLVPKSFSFTTNYYLKDK